MRRILLIVTAIVVASITVSVDARQPSTITIEQLADRISSQRTRSPCG